MRPSTAELRGGGSRQREVLHASSSPPGSPRDHSKDRRWNAYLNRLLLLLTSMLVLGAVAPFLRSRGFGGIFLASDQSDNQAERVSLRGREVQDEDVIHVAPEDTTTRHAASADEIRVIEDTNQWGEDDSASGGSPASTTTRDPDIIQVAKDDTKATALRETTHPNPDEVHVADPETTRMAGSSTTLDRDEVRVAPDDSQLVQAPTSQRPVPELGGQLSGNSFVHSEESSLAIEESRL